MDITPPSFLAYTPVLLAFGTSGLRGKVDDMTDLEVYVNVAGALTYLVASGDIAPESSVAIAGDLRPSTPRIMRAVAHAIRDRDMTVENAGTIPTPALAAHAFGKGIASVMVTGSHIPFDRNGIKLMKSKGEVLKADEAGILAEVARARASAYASSSDTSPFDARGMLKDSLPLPEQNKAAEEAYLARYKNAFAAGCLAKMRVLVYQHSAVGRDVLVRILSELGAEVVAAGRTDTFIPIDTENVTRADLDHLEHLASEASSEPFDAIVSTDGDSDRPFIVAPVDAPSGLPRVRFLPGDLLGIVVAGVVRPDAVAVPISANDAVVRAMHASNVELVTTRIGSPYVIEALEELAKRGFKRPVGWEANGGFLVWSALDFGGEPLSALPTRDAVLPILANLYAARTAGVSLGALWDRLPPRYGRSGLIDGVPVATSRALLARLVPDGAAVDTCFAEQPVPEWQAALTIARDHFTAMNGFSDPVRVNVLDGVRISFRNGDVVHLRPSGNAPQLRVYATADTDARAEEIVAMCLREPDGVLRSLIRLAETPG